MAVQFLFGLQKAFAGFQQGFAWNTANAQTSPTKGGSFIDAGDIQAELGGANGGDIPAGATPNDDQIVLSAWVFQRRGGCTPTTRSGEFGRRAAGKQDYLRRRLASVLCA